MQDRRLVLIGRLGGGRLLRNGQIKKAIGSYFTSNREAVEAAQSGAIEIELIPQGTLAEALRAGGAGLGGFFTPTAAGTLLTEAREIRHINGVEQVFQPALRGDVALIRAWKRLPLAVAQFVGPPIARRLG